MIRFLLLLLSSAGLCAETLTLIPNTSNSNYTPSASQLVTIGVPFAPCLVTDTGDYRLLDGSGAEVPVFVKETLYWPNTKSCGVKSTRAIKVQFVMNATAGVQTYTWDLAGRNTADLAEQPVAEIESSIANRAGYDEPAVFGILSPSYLVQTQLVTPTTPANENVFDQFYYPAKFDYAVVDGLSFTAPRAQDWLLDTTSTIYKQALRRGEVEQYRQAYLNHEFYMDHIVTTLRYGSSSCPGGWGLKTTDYCIDGKLIYTELAKLHIALTGDDTWLPADESQIGDTLHEVIISQADLLFTGSKRTQYTDNGATYPAGFRVPYDSRNDLYTERHAGIGLISILNACEITHDTATCAAVNTAIDNIYDHNLDTNNVWDTPYTGYQKHSWMKHENAQAPWVGIIDSITDSNTLTVRNTVGSPDGIVPGSMLTTRSTFTTTGAIYEDAGKFYVPVAGSVGNTPVGATPVYVRGALIGRALPSSNPDVFQIYKSTATAANSDYSQYPAGTVLSITQVNLTVDSITDKGESWTVDIAQSTGALMPGESMLVARNTIFPDSDEAFSPWMSSVLMDGLWQFYHWTDDAARKQKAAQVILGLARATIAFSIDARTTQASTVAAIEAAFADWPTADGIDIIAGINDYEYADSAPLSRYTASYWQAMPGATADFINNMSPGGYQKQHLPELIHVMSLGMFFETDTAKRDAMELVAEQSMAWFEEYRNTVVRGAIRSYPWQLRSDPFGTWQRVKGVAVVPIEPVVPDEPDPVVDDPEPADPDPVTDAPPTDAKPWENLTIGITYTRTGGVCCTITVDGVTTGVNYQSSEKALQDAHNILRNLPGATVRVLVNEEWRVEGE